jgi:hypothetical protein
MGDTEEVLEEEETTSEVEEPTTEENVEEPSEAVQEYKLKHDGKEVNFTQEQFDEFYGDWSNEKKWKSKLNDKGRKLNQLRDDLQTKEAQLKQDEHSLNEWKKLKKAIEANPKAYGLMNKLLNESEPSIDPAIKKLEDEVKSFRAETKRKEASIELSRDLPDFDYEKLNNFANDFDLSNPKDAMLFTYYAEKGSHHEDDLREAKANLVREAKKKKGMPATAGKQESSPKKYKNIDDWANDLKDQIEKGVLKI